MQEVYEQAVRHLRQHDPVLAPVIQRAGLCTITPNDDYYGELVDAVVSQQLSVKAAATIMRRLKGLFGGDMPTPDQIIVTDTELLRSAGLSGAKASYIKSLAQHIRGGQLELEKFPSLSNEAITKELTAVKGIGEWTTHMFLIFAMGRMNVLPTGDLGIKSGIKKLYGLESLPSPTQIQQLAARNQWHPYESIACWYIWKAFDTAPEL